MSEAHHYAPDMDLKRTEIPSDEDVRRLLSLSRESPDPRVAPAITLILALSMSVTELNRLHWSDLELPVGILHRRSGSRSSSDALTEFTVRQLLAILPYRSGPYIFHRSENFPQPLRESLEGILVRGNLNFAIEDFVRWSQTQSAQVRHSIATAAQETT